VRLTVTWRRVSPCSLPVLPWSIQLCVYMLQDPAARLARGALDANPRPLEQRVKRGPAWQETTAVAWLNSTAQALEAIADPWRLWLTWDVYM
jgi:hypothetical protein